MGWAQLPAAGGRARVVMGTVPAAPGVAPACPHPSSGFAVIASALATAVVSQNAALGM